MIIKVQGPPGFHILVCIVILKGKLSQKLV